MRTRNTDALGLAMDYAACMEACAAYCAIKRPSIRCPEPVAALLAPLAAALKQEVFWVLLLDTKNKLIGEPVEATRGLLDSSPVHPREVFGPAVREAAASIILAHNHPSGDPTPSTQDIDITKRLVEASRILGIRIVDHVIIGTRGVGDLDSIGPGYVSLRERNLVAFE